MRAAAALAVLAVSFGPFSCDSTSAGGGDRMAVTAQCNDGAVEVLYTVPPGNQHVSTRLGGRVVTDFTEPASASERTVVSGVPDEAGMRFDVLLAGRQAATLRLPRC